MSRWKLMGGTGTDRRIVLVLHGDQAFWFREGGPNGIESFTETIENGGPELHSCCPWIRPASGSAMPCVHLVLDSHLDEVDRVRVPGLSGGWLRHLQCWRMRRQLRADYPTAGMHTLAANAAPDALSIVHNLIPEHWQSWLALLQKEHVTVSHVVTSLELLCRLSGGHSDLKGGPVLFASRVGEYTRHLLLDDGVPVFMRLVPTEGTAQTLAGNAAIDETLEHVRRQIIRSAEIPVIAFMETADDKPVAAACMALATLCLTGEAHWRRVSPEADALADTSTDTRPGDSTNVSDRKGSIVAWLRRLAGRGRRRHGQRWRLTAAHRFADDLLQVSVTRNAMQARIRQLQKATLICVWVAAATVVVASVHGVASARDRARLGRQQQQVTGQIEHLSSQASALHRHPAFVVSAMERIAAYQSMGTVNAAEVLATVAEALEQFPALLLDDIAWSVVHDEAGDTVLATMSQAPSRDRLWQEGTSQAGVQVELGGLVVSEQGLREQQRTLQGFADYLQAMPGVSAVTLIESPLSVARSSKHLSGGESAYRLSLLMGVS
ncbi:hypothetical protein ACUNV4_12895 [Granulosicoccus sp. 3-233]|uniref:hypothetical protein n=1 Tax=Granulosicoccus sp. 3-233 TaxID=3417969 RepID=UPI003D354353